MVVNVVIKVVVKIFVKIVVMIVVKIVVIASISASSVVFFISFLTIATTQTSAAPGWQIAETLRADQVDRRSTKNVGVAIQSWWLSGYLRIGSLNLLIDIVAKGPANGEE